MIRGAHIARFRGIRECVADGFGRVNLIIGKNDCGKTTFMEAIQLVEIGDDAAHHIIHEQRLHLGRRVKSNDLERFWQSIFFNFDTKGGFLISVSRDDGAQRSLEVRQGTVSEEIILDPSEAQGDREEAYDKEEIGRPLTWSLDIQLTPYDSEPSRQRVVATSTRIKLPPVSQLSGSSAWITPSAGVGEHEVRYVSALKQRGQDGTVVELLREVDSRLSGIELLAPSGDVAELFVRLNEAPMLPVKLMGEGFQRCLELGVAAAAHDWPTLFIDEIENGMHHLVLEPLWRWIATTARRRNLQVFATTHSEECIQAACRAFQGLDDDGLRVIRLDRLESETRAIIYDRALIEVAERTGTEIRG